MRKRVGKVKLPFVIFGLLAAAALVCAAVRLLNGKNAERLVVLDEEQIRAVLTANVYDDDSSRAIAEAAASLAGKVHYFWGGKSFCVGPDPEWGEPRTVTSQGSRETGTLRPFGLDCSGYVTWVYIQLDRPGIAERIGNGTWAQWQNSAPIEWKEIKVGDLVFQNEYPGASSNHVAVCIGYYDGQPVFAHCSSAEDNVVVTTAGRVFRYARRPSV